MRAPAYYVIEAPLNTKLVFSDAARIELRSTFISLKWIVHFKKRTVELAKEFLIGFVV